MYGMLSTSNSFKEKSQKNRVNPEISTLIYNSIYYLGKMQCDTCGLMLESVGEDQIERGGRFSKPIVYCDRHKPLKEVFA